MKRISVKYQPITPWVDAGVRLLLASPFIWLALCVFSTLWLSHQADLSAEDMRLMSWGVSFTNASYISTVPFKMLSICSLLMGFAAMFKGRKWALGTALITIGMLLWVPSSLERMAPVYLAGGATKIGCFVESSRQCKEMLGIPVAGAPSIYEDGGETAWYREELKFIDVPSVFEIPGYAFLVSPVVVWQEYSSIKARIERQRERIRFLREQASITDLGQAFR